MATAPLALLVAGATTAVSAGSSIAQAQAQNKYIKRSKAVNAKIAEINADRRREQIATEFAKVAGSLRVSAGERGNAAARSSQALSLSSLAQANRANAQTALDEFLGVNRGAGVYQSVFTEGLVGGLQGLNYGLQLGSGLEDAFKN